MTLHKNHKGNIYIGKPYPCNIIIFLQSIIIIYFIMESE
jgi:hypothetical protein